jgi:putative tryptophan/tyrosine transport system substrate-binding protein
MKRREFIAGLVGAAAGPIIRPIAVRAQRGALPLIGRLAGRSATDDNDSIAFRRGLEETGYVEGRNVAIEQQFSDDQNDRLPALAAYLVRRGPVVIVANGGLNVALAAKAATATIPVVFTIGVDPVEFGLVNSLSRPGGNLTGVVFLTNEVMAKRLELLHEFVPAATSIAFLANLTSRSAEADQRQLQVAARVLGLRLSMLNVVDASQIEPALATFAQMRADALLVSSEPLFTGRREQIVAMAARHAVPAVYAWRDYVVAGGLMSYGTSRADGYRQAGIYAGRILKGERPGDLPVQQSTKVELVVNLKTAKSLGLSFPLSLLGRADEVIE